MASLLALQTKDDPEQFEIDSKMDPLVPRWPRGTRPQAGIIFGTSGAILESISNRTARNSAALVTQSGFIRRAPGYGWIEARHFSHCFGEGVSSEADGRIWPAMAKRNSTLFTDLASPPRMLDSRALSAGAMGTHSTAEWSQPVRSTTSQGNGHCSSRQLLE